MVAKFVVNKFDWLASLTRDVTESSGGMFCFPKRMWVIKCRGSSSKNINRNQQYSFQRNTKDQFASPSKHTFFGRQVSSER